MTFVFQKIIISITIFKDGDCPVYVFFGILVILKIKSCDFDLNISPH